jgi:hypothetical protein
MRIDRQVIFEDGARQNEVPPIITSSGRGEAIV